MSTASTDLLYQAVRARLLAYVDAGGHALGINVWRLTAPPSETTPYAVLSLKSPRVETGSDGLKQLFDCEVMLFGRPRSAQAAIETLADRALAALVTWRDTSNGVVYAVNASVQSLPPYASPADADLVQVRVLATLHVWPTYLTSL